jgi:hypothetical protein
MIKIKKISKNLIVLSLLGSLLTPAIGMAHDVDNNPPGPAGGPGTNWENPPGPGGGWGASPDRHPKYPLWFFNYGPYYAHHHDRDNNPPGPIGGPGTNWENPPGPMGGPGTSPNRR